MQRLSSNANTNSSRKDHQIHQPAVAPPSRPSKHRHNDKEQEHAIGPGALHAPKRRFVEDKCGNGKPRHAHIREALPAKCPKPRHRTQSEQNPRQSEHPLLVRKKPLPTGKKDEIRGHVPLGKSILNQLGKRQVDIVPGRVFINIESTIKEQRKQNGSKK